jgi:acyl-CoA thioesterase II
LSDDGQRAVDEFLALLDLEQIDDDIFRGGNPNRVQRPDVFGGQVAAQALIAAGRTVDPDRAVHSLHAYFIRRSNPKAPIVFTVDRIRDGGSFTTRRIVAIQDGEGIFALEASFQLTQPGITHQSPMPAVPPADELTRTIRFRAPLPDAEPPPPEMVELVFDRRTLPLRAEPSGRTIRRDWARAAGRLPDNPLVHAAALTYISDIIPAGPVFDVHNLRVADVNVRDVRVASLDHAVWFHRPIRADEWMLFECESPSASGSRALSTARVFSADGTQIASFAQEFMIRVR